MKNSFLILLILCFSILACEEKNPGKSDSKKANVTAQVVIPDTVVTPDGFSKIGEADGDLNVDGRDEKVIVYDTPREGDFGTEREIHIFQLKNNRWEPWHTSVGPVMSSESGGMMGDPFAGVMIERGCIVFNHFGGSRYKWEYTHRFRHQNETWQLIGATVVAGAPCEYWENFDYNLSIGKVVYSKETEVCNDAGEETGSSVTKEENFTLKLEVLPEMDGFATGEHQMKFPNSDVKIYY